MANLKDLIVRGVSRFIGKVYATDIEASGNIDLSIQNGTAYSTFWNIIDPDSERHDIGIGFGDTATSGVGGAVIVEANGVYITSNSSGVTTIQNVKTPTQDTDAANKKYVDDAIAAIPLYDGTVTG